MSHFTVLVIDTKGVELEKHLAPFQENNMGDCPKEYLEFKDVEEESRKEYETEGRNEFYCGSSSSAGFELKPSKFKELNKLKLGEEGIFSFIKGDIGVFGYLQGGKCYRGAVNFGKKNHKTKWFKVIEVIRTTHPDKNVCFEGTVRVKIIGAPRKIKHKKFYGSFDEFMREWHGYTNGRDEQTGKYGYWHNPNSKWDWYVVGGRWAGMLKIKEQHAEVAGKLNFSWGWSEKDKLEVLSQRVADTALKGEVDWDAYHNGDDFDEACRHWEMLVEGSAPENEKEKEWLAYPLHYNKEYLLEKYKDKITYAKSKCSFTTHAVLKDGQWFEKGEMGWFGCSSDTPEEGLNFELSYFDLSYFDRFIKDLPEDARLTVVDCHI